MKIVDESAGVVTDVLPLVAAKPIAPKVLIRKLSEADQLKIQNEKNKLSLAQRDFRIFVLELYAEYGLTKEDVIDEQGNIVKTGENK